jgi:hypothetical protein
MLRITQSVSAGAAEEYFRQALRAGEYCAQKDQSVGIGGGVGAQELHLMGEVDKNAFRNLANGLHPTSEQQLTACLDEDRRPGYDFTFSVPKSASVLAALGTESDRTIVRAIFDRAVDETMKEIESEMKARVREKGADHDRITGNMVWARFDHLVTRPVDGLPDPHLHAHVYVFNLTRGLTLRPSMQGECRQRSPGARGQTAQGGQQRRQDAAAGSTRRPAFNVAGCTGKLWHGITGAPRPLLGRQAMGPRRFPATRSKHSGKMASWSFTAPPATARKVPCW